MPTALRRAAISNDGTLSESDLDDIQRAKFELLSQEGVLDFEPDTAAFSNIGGLDSLKQWLDIRSSVFTGKVSVPGLDRPKGIVLLGVQGCGKSLAAKAVAGVWGVPLLRLDFGSLFNKFYGETERNLRESLKTAEAMSPCVLWIDEIEKGISTDDTDGGTSRRVLGTFLTWMAEHQGNVFIVATANEIEALPPELVRKGRFDEIFFVDLPDPETREEILSIHLQQRQLDADTFAIDSLVQQCDGFSGAEIEQAVVSAMYTAHAQNCQLGSAHLMEEMARTQPPFGGHGRAYRAAAGLGQRPDRPGPLSNSGSAAYQVLLLWTLATIALRAGSRSRRPPAPPIPRALYRPDDQ